MKKVDRKFVQVLAKRLRAARLRRKLTQRQVSDQSNIHFTTYNKYEMGVSAPTVFNLMLMARVLDVTSDYLLGLNEVGDDASAGVVSKELRKFTDRYYNLTENQKGTILSAMKSMTMGRPS